MPCIMLVTSKLARWWALTVNASAVGKPTPRHNCFVRDLSMANAQPSTSDPVNGIPKQFNTAWVSPSSPPRPCSAINATSICKFANSSNERSAGSNQTTSTAFSSNAAKIALPERRLTSRSAELPPAKTATLPLKALITAVIAAPYWCLSSDLDQASMTLIALLSHQHFRHLGLIQCHLALKYALIFLVLAPAPSHKVVQLAHAAE